MSEVSVSDPDQDSIGGEIPWKPPVIAAIVGALLVAMFVIYAVVNGPSEPSESDVLDAQPVPSNDLPAGYTPISDDTSVGIKVESVTTGGESKSVVVSSAVVGTTDPADSSIPDIAYWEIGSSAARTEMDAQYATIGAIGTTTIMFPGAANESDTFVVAYPTLGWKSVGTQMEVPPEMVGESFAFGLEVEPGSEISGLVTIGDGWGTVEWNAPSGMVATLDVNVTFVGTESPAADVLELMRFSPAYEHELSRPGTVITPRPLWGFRGTYTLKGDGRSLTDGGELTTILIGLVGTVVTETAEPVVLNLPAGES